MCAILLANLFVDYIPNSTIEEALVPIYKNLDQLIL